MKARDIMTLDEFISCVMDGGIIDDDGYGRYATETETSQLEAVPSRIKAGDIDRTFTHVEWFNK